MKFLKGSAKDGKITVAVTDYFLDETHYFHATENEGTKIYSFDFVYRATIKGGNSDYDRRVSRYDAVLIPVGDSLTAKLIIYENKKRRKIRSEATLQLSRSKTDFIPAARFFMMDNMVSRQSLTYPFSAVIESVSYEVHGMMLRENKKFIRPIQLKLVVPRKVYRDGNPYTF